MSERPGLMTSDPVTPADIVFGALMEVGRADLAELVQVFQDDDGSWYTEPIEDVTAPADLALLERADRMANEWVARTGWIL